MLQKLINRLRRAWLGMRVRTLEIELDDHVTTLAHTRDPEARAIACIRRDQISRELARARAAWVASRPPGVRCEWDTA